MRNVRVLSLARALGGLSFVAPIQALFLFQRGMSFEDVMWLETVLSVAILVLEVPTGYLADALGRRWSLILGAAVGLAAWVPFMLAQGFWMFAVSFALTGLSMSLASGAEQALLWEDLAAGERAHDMQRVVGRMGALTATAAGAAALAGGLLAGIAGPGYALLYGLTIGAQAAGLVALIALAEPARAVAPPDGRRANPFAHARQGVRAIRASPGLLRIALMVTLAVPFTSVLAYAYQPYLQQSGVPTAMFGAVIVAASVAGIAARGLAHRLHHRLGGHRALLLTTLAPAGAWAAMAVVGGVVAAPALYVLLAGSAEARGPLVADYLNRHIDDRVRATVLSIISLAAALYMIIVRPLLGSLAGHSLSACFIAIAGIIVLATLLTRARAHHLAPEPAAASTVSCMARI